MLKNSNNKTVKNEMNNFPGIVYRRYKDSAGKFTYDFLNDEIYKMLDIPSDEEIIISAKGYIDSVHWADRYLISQQIEKSEKDLTSYTESFRIINKKGQVFWLSGRVIATKQEDDSVMWEGFLFDETSKKQAEQKLNIILERSTDVIVNTDKNGTITDINTAVSEVFGYEISELIGQNISFLLAPEDKTECDNFIGNYLEKENDVFEDASVFEYLGLKKNGDYFPIEFSISALRMQGELSFIVLIKDIREQKETLATLKDTEEKLSTIVSALPCAFFTMLINSETNYRMIYISDGSSDIFGYSPEQLFVDYDKYIPLVLKEAKFDEYVKKLYSSKILPYYDEELPNFSKKDSWVQIRIKPERLDNGHIVCHGVVLDVTERKKASEQISYLAYYHPVTDTPNRALLSKEIITILENAEKDNKKVAVLSLSSTNLSSFYSSSGHDVGDALLNGIADRVKGCLTSDDFIAYTTSGLFVIVRPYISNDDEISALTDKILKEFQAPIIVNEQIFDININIGIAIYPEHGSDANSLIKNSNAALEKARKDYKDYKIFSQEIKQAIVNANSLRTKLRYALDNGEIIPYFQPQIDIQSGKIVGTEALARWISNEGIISPGIFIPIAEEFGLIDLIAESILEKACAQNQKWIEQGVLSAPVAVNLSPRQFHNPKNLLAMIEGVLEKTKLSPDKLEIEITESSTMINPMEAERVIKILLEKGITCSIDDFGTGYSSLSVLKRFPLNKLKIDRSFVIDITNDYNDASIVSATIAMAKALNLKVLAEGVETKDIYCLLRDIGCTSIQGFLFSKALPADEMTEFAKNWNPEEVLNSLSSC